MIEPEAPPRPDGPGAPQRPSRFRVSLASVLLATVVVAVWISAFALYREHARIAAELQGLREAARELIVEPGRVSAVYKHPFRGGETWEVHLPPRPAYVLRLATEGVDSDGLADAERSLVLPPGRHRLELQRTESSDGDTVRLFVDGREAFVVEKTAGWDPEQGSEGGTRLTASESYDPGRPVVLFRQRFFVPINAHSSRSPTGPTPGVMLWIQPL